MKNLKYIAIGILVGYLGLYVHELTQNKKSPFIFADPNQNKENNEY